MYVYEGRVETDKLLLNFLAVLIKTSGNKLPVVTANKLE